MDPKFPVPQDVVQGLLVWIFGSSSIVVLIFLLVKALLAWYGAAQSAHRVGKISLDVARRTSDRLLEMRPLAIGFGIMLSVMLLILQSIWLGSTFIVGNGLSYLFFGDVPAEGPQWDAVVRGLRWDGFTKIYVAAAVVALLFSYKAAYERREVTAIGIAIASPALLWGILAGFAAVFAVLLSTLKWLSEGKFVLDQFGKATLALSAMALTYAIACQVAVRSSGLVVRVWQRNP